MSLASRPVVGRHMHPVLCRIGVGMIVLGFVLVALPPIPVDTFDAVEDVWTKVHWSLWLKFAGATLLVVGNTLRLIGVQGHPGLPWPLYGRGLSDELKAAIAVRRRALENRRKALGEGRC